MKKFRSFKQVEEKSKKEPKSKIGLYLAIFLTVVMVGGVAGILLDNPGTSQTYSFGKYTFKPSNGQFTTSINGKTITFNYLPQQVQSINASPEVIDAIRNAQGFILSFNPNQNITEQLQVMDLLRFDFTNAVVDTYKNTKPVYMAVTQNTPLYNLSVITCENSSAAVPVILMDYSNETSITFNNNCIIISATSEYDMVTIDDYLRYVLYGVI